MTVYRANRSTLNFNNSGDKARSLADASGLPTPVQSLSASVIGTTQINLTWSAPTFAGDSAITSYVVSNTPAGGSVNISGTSASVTGLTPGTAYTFTVQAANAVGRGIPGSVSATTATFNAATGGTTNDVSNYNGTGQTWRVHTFTSSGTFSVTSGSQPFRVLCVGGGGIGVGTWGGEGGQVTENTSVTIPTGNTSVTVGNGAAFGGDGVGVAGGDSSLGSLVTGLGARAIGSNTGTSAPGGAGNRGANPGGGPSGCTGGAGGNGGQSAISGTSTFYGGGGGGQTCDGGVPNSGGPGGAGGGGNGFPPRSDGVNGLGGGSGGWFANSKSGGSGRVMISYRIA